MTQIATKYNRKFYKTLDSATLEKYMTKVTDSRLRLLEEYTHLINQMYENELVDFNDAIHLQHINKRLSKKLSLARRTKPESLVQHAIELAIKEKENEPIKGP